MKNLLLVVQYNMQCICSLGSLLFNFSSIYFSVLSFTSSNLCPSPISVPLVSYKVKKGTNFDSYFLDSNVVRFPIPSFANISPNNSFINVLFPTPLVPIITKFIFSNSFIFNSDCITEINLLFIFSIIFSCL